jgi:hypothetical protein
MMQAAGMWNRAYGALKKLQAGNVEIDADIAAKALKEALEKYPAFAHYGPRLEWRALFQGGAWAVQYGQDPPRETPGAWDFQNAFVKGYKRMAGVS